MIAARIRLFRAGVVFAFPCALGAQDGKDSLRVELEAFIDVYHAFDFGRPANFDRRFTTTAARHGETNVNLAYLGASVTSPRVRSRLALQFGTSVQANSAAEPRVGVISGPEVSRFLQEAFVGYRVRSNIWIDAGIYFAPFGPENWISSDNWTYTRSLIADFSPYYAAGVRSVWKPTDKVQAQLHVMNGWQNISESNRTKGVGVRFDYAPTAHLRLAYNAFVGNEQPEGTRTARRTYQEITARFLAKDGLEFSAAADFGAQQSTTGNIGATWSGWTLLGRHRIAEPIWVAARVERFSDPSQAVATTGVSHGLRASGASVTVDVAPEPHLLWRFEMRRLHAKDPVFDDSRVATGLTRTNLLFVASLSLRVP